MSTESLTVISRDGLKGYTLGPPDSDNLIRIRFDDGREVKVDQEALVPRPDGSYTLSLTAGDLTSASQAGATQVIPVVAEELAVERRRVATGGVRVNKYVREHEELVDMPILREHVDVRRVMIDRVVDGPQPVRYEGDTTIVPLLEEVLVVEKRLVLKEEVHITRSRTEERTQQKVVLRKEEAEIHRVDAEGRPIREEAVAPVMTPVPVAPSSRPIRRNKVILDD